MKRLETRNSSNKNDSNPIPIHQISMHNFYGPTYKSSMRNINSLSNGFGGNYLYFFHKEKNSAKYNLLDNFHNWENLCHPQHIYQQWQNFGFHLSLNYDYPMIMSYFWNNLYLTFRRWCYFHSDFSEEKENSY